MTENEHGKRAPAVTSIKRVPQLLQSRMMFTGIEHFAIASPNPRRLADFYVATLEFEISYEYAGNYFVQAKDGALIEIIPAEGDRPESAMRTPGLRHIAISIDNFDAAYEHLQQQGIKFEGEPYEVQGNRLAFFKDPDGESSPLDLSLEASEIIVRSRLQGLPV